MPPLETRSYSPDQKKAVIELIFAGSIWGFGFVAQKMAQEVWDPVGSTALRFTLTFFIVLPFLALKRFRRISIKKHFRLALLPGFLLGGVLMLQNTGLLHTQVANSGFITTLYFMFVPIVDRLIWKKKIPSSHMSTLIVALIGTGLLCRVHEARFNFGDLVTLGCSVIAAFHISYVGSISHRIDSPLVFNLFQAFWLSILAWILTPLLGTIPTLAGSTMRSWLGMAHLAIGSSAIAFMIQIRAQKLLPTHTVSILFLLEAPFATLFGYLVCHETLTLIQGIGAMIILVACGKAARRLD